MMARTAAAVCILLYLVEAAAQRPSPISGDEAAPAPPQPTTAPPASPSAPAAPGAPAAPAAPAVPASVPERPGCTLGAYHAVGDSWFTSGREGCLKYTCQRSGVVSSQPCARVLAPEGCVVKDGAADALYPACCPRRECAAAVPLPAVVVADVPTTTTAAPSTSPSTTTSSEAPSTTTSSEAPSTSTSNAAP